MKLDVDWKLDVTTENFLNRENKTSKPNKKNDTENTPAVGLTPQYSRSTRTSPIKTRI